MTDYKELAQRIVAQGVGECINVEFYRPPNCFGALQLLSAEQFCQDGRVVLALMEKAGPGSWASRVKFSATVNLHKAHAYAIAIALAESCLAELEGE